jgi:transposase
VYSTAQTKGQVEGLVGFTRRNFLVPIPRINSLESLNADLEQQCRDDRVLPVGVHEPI